MRKVLFLLGGVLVSILLNVTANLFDRNDALLYSKWGWFGVLLYGTYLLFTTDRVRGVAERLRPKSKGARVMSYIVAALLAATLGVAYWAGINGVYAKIFQKQDAPKEAVINVDAYPMLVDYEPGTDVGGIKWSALYSDLRVTLTNPMEEDYEDLDFTITTDLKIVRVAQLSGIPNVTFFVGPNKIPPVWPTGKKDANGNDLYQPMTPSPGAPQTAKTYRVRCDKMPRRSKLELVIALMGSRPMVNNNPWTMMDKRPPQHVEVEGQFRAFGEIRKLAFTKDFSTTPLPNPPTHSDVRIEKIQLDTTTDIPSVLIVYKNRGAIPTKTQALLAKFFVQSRPSQGAIGFDKAFADFVAEFEGRPPNAIQWPPPIIPNGSQKSLFQVPELKGADDLNQLKQGDKVLYFVGGILFSDTTGHYRKAFCRVFAPQRPEFNGMEWAQAYLPNAGEWESKASEDTY
jgi:hypothetical protein